jgi:asparagine synthetase B (glutamine-hydrolysing)
MCGIWGLIQLNHLQCKQSQSEKLPKQHSHGEKSQCEQSGDYLDFMEILNSFNNIKHRGPDNSILQNYKNVWVGFHRLSIIDTSFVSNQPFILNKGEDTIVFVCNGEIYNYKELI